MGLLRRVTHDPTAMAGSRDAAPRVNLLGPLAAGLSAAADDVLEIQPAAELVHGIDVGSGRCRLGGHGGRRHCAFQRPTSMSASTQRSGESCCSLAGAAVWDSRSRSTVPIGSGRDSSRLPR